MLQIEHTHLADIRFFKKNQHFNFLFTFDKQLLVDWKEK